MVRIGLDELAPLLPTDAAHFAFGAEAIVATDPLAAELQQ